MLELKNISYKIDDEFILKNINLEIKDHEFVLITGPNGSGKSTLVKIIMGLIKPTSGSILINGYDITDKSVYERAKMGITFTFQTPVVFKGLTVRDLLCISRDYYYDDYIGKELLRKVGLCAKEYLDREVNNSLSGGELKRIELACALGKQGSYILFDEPEAGIDLWSFEDLTNIFKSMKRFKKSGMLVISHQERLFNLADRIVIIENGTIKEIGSKNKISKYLKNSKCEKCMRDCNE